MRIVSKCGRQKQNDPPLLNAIMYAQHAPNNICSYNEFLFITLKTCKDTLHFNWRIIKLKMNHSPVFFSQLLQINYENLVSSIVTHSLKKFSLLDGRAAAKNESRRVTQFPILSMVLSDPFYCLSFTCYLHKLLFSGRPN